METLYCIIFYSAVIFNQKRKLQEKMWKIEMELMEELSPTASVHSPQSPFFNPSSDEEDNHMPPPPQAGEVPTVN